MANTLTPSVARRARDAFLRALELSAPAYELGQLNLFHDDDEAYIAKEVARHLYEPELPAAGDKERRMIERLEKLASDREWEGAPRAWALAAAFKTLLAENPRHPGRYYVRRPVTPKTDKAAFEWGRALVESARSAKLWDRKWFAEQVLAGFPESVSNFKMECLFLLRNSEGLVTRLVRLTNVKGEKSRGPNPGGSEILDAKSFSGSEKFSEWVQARGNFVWDAGVTELRLLQEDIANDAAWRVVNLVESVGWHPLPGKPVQGVQPGLWFFDEVAYTITAGGLRVLRPDEDNIIWHEGEGYYLSRKGRESQFLQGRPGMQPDRKVAELLRGMEWSTPPADQTEAGLLRAFFRELGQRLLETLGDESALVALGSMFSYAAAPELFKRHGLFPGLFVHGLKGSGKTKVTSWLMSVWGFQMPSGISLSERTSTAVGMLQELENYSELPVWFDEFRDHQIDPGKHSIIRNAYDRSPQAKWSPDGKQREIRTALVISGESTTRDAATRSRYPHIQVSAHKRRQQHLQWFTTHREVFFVLGRVLLERRAEFVAGLFGSLQSWVAREALRDVDEREKLVHGISYAGWVAMVGLLESHDATEVSSFSKYMQDFLRSAAADVREDSNISLFWTDLVIAADANGIPLECFHLETTTLSNQPGTELKARPDGSVVGAQGMWSSHRLYLDPDAVLKHMQIFLAKARGAVVLNRNDLRDQLSKEPSWIPGRLTKRFRGKGTRKCWGFEIDAHPMGARVVSDEEYQQFLHDADAGDPRKGELFSLIERILQAKKDQADAES